MKPNLISLYEYLHTQKNTIFNVCTIHNHVLKQIAIDLDYPFARITNYQMLKSNFCVIFNSSIWKVSTTNHFCDEFLSLPTFKVDSESVFPAKKNIFLKPCVPSSMVRWNEEHQETWTARWKKIIDASVSARKEGDRKWFHIFEF